MSRAFASVIVFRKDGRSVERSLARSRSKVAFHRPLISIPVTGAKTAAGAARRSAHAQALPHRSLLLMLPSCIFCLLRSLVLKAKAHQTPSARGKPFTSAERASSAHHGERKGKQKFCSLFCSITVLCAVSLDLNSAEAHLQAVAQAQAVKQDEVTKQESLELVKCLLRVVRLLVVPLPGLPRLACRSSPTAHGCNSARRVKHAAA